MNILDQIINNTRKDLKDKKNKIPIEKLDDLAEQQVSGNVFHRFYKALNSSHIEIIAEVKRASPSRGIICKDFDPVRIAHEYANGGAAAISVLTEGKYFMGSIKYLTDIATQVNLPLLRKDFIIDKYQIYEAAAHSASAVLLIAAALSEQHLRDFLSLIHSLKMDALVEIHDRDELAKTLNTDAGIIGINNRDLRTFETRLEKSLDLVKEIPLDKIKVSESGIKSRRDITRLENAGFDAVLIGETLMRQPNRTAFIRELRGVSCG